MIYEKLLRLKMKNAKACHVMQRKWRENLSYNTLFSSIFNVIFLTFFEIFVNWLFPIINYIWAKRWKVSRETITSHICNTIFFSLFTLLHANKQANYCSIISICYMYFVPARIHQTWLCRFVYKTRLWIKAKMQYILQRVVILYFIALP